MCDQIPHAVSENTLKALRKPVLALFGDCKFDTVSLVVNM